MKMHHKELLCQKMERELQKSIERKREEMRLKNIATKMSNKW